MAQEEHTLNSSHSVSGGGATAGGGGSGGGSSDKSKNIKQKKVPQRGLGVAQLEKIRLEEQRKREALEAANVLANNAIGSANDAAPSPANFPSQNTLYRSVSSVPFQITSQSNGDITSPGNGNWARLWNGEYSFDGQRQRNDFAGVAFGPPQSSLQFESNPSAAPLPSVPQRSYRFQRPSSPVVNAPLGISPSALMEPPSNQIVHGSNYTLSWPEEYKMVGMKRSYPFSLESLPARSFPGNYDPTSAASRSRSDELTSCTSGYAAHAKPRNKYIRDGSSNRNSLPEQDPREVIRDDGKLNGDFLTLAPPTAALPASNSNYKHPLDYSGSEGPALPDFKCFPSEENLRSQIHQPASSRSGEEPFSFFRVRSEIDQTAVHGKEEKGETVDLNLKL